MVRAVQTKLDRFFGQFKLLHYKKGEAFLHAEDPPPGIFYLKAGYVRVHSISEQGEDLTLIIFAPGNCFPLTWAINNSPNTYNLEAMTDVEIWRAPKDKFVNFVNKNPDILLEFLRRALTRLLAFMTRMEQLVFGNSYEKVASILFLAGKRFGKKKGRLVVIEVPLTHKDVGSLAGIARETTSLAMEKLEKKGLITYHRGLIAIKNLQKLKNESIVTSS